MTLDEILKSNRIGDVFILSRYFYRIGEPIIADSVYEKVLQVVTKYAKEDYQDYLDRTYDDDPVPYELLAEIGVEPVRFVTKEGRQDLFNYLNEEKSNSIRSFTGYNDAYNFFMTYVQNEKDLMVSLKMDGDNTKSLYLNGEFRLSLSRGRSGTSFDFTDTICRVLPGQSESLPEEVKVYSECFVEPDYLETLREKYKQDGYKTAKSAAISLLRVQHKTEDYEHLKVVTFFIDRIADTLEETFSKGEEYGFTIVPHKLIHYSEIPTEFETFKTWLKKEVFDYFAVYKENGWPCDGIVVEVNDLNYTGSQVNQYNSRQCALKFEQWSFSLYQAKVEEIIWTQKRVTASCRLRIKPLRTDDGCEAQYVNVFNHRILVKEGITVGSTIYFERNSGAVNILVYGDRLKEKLNKGE